MVLKAVQGKVRIPAEAKKTPESEDSDIAPAGSPPSEAAPAPGDGINWTIFKGPGSRYKDAASGGGSDGTWTDTLFSPGIDPDIIAGVGHD